MEQGRQQVDASGGHPPHFPNADFDAVALAVSAGGFQALSQILASLPPISQPRLWWSNTWTHVIAA
jgi:chemotaxis response regulator CheB